MFCREKKEIYLHFHIYKKELWWYHGAVMEKIGKTMLLNNYHIHTP